MMTNFEYLQSLSVDKLAKWLDEHGQFDGSPWMDFFNENYCKKCEAITVERDVSKDKLGISALCGGDTDCAWCELHHKCKYFQELDDVPDNEEIIKMWLNHEVDNGKDM
jgi:hypothetical protein